jgi:HD-GYP domain-containing protein (c-di-GMP phosphodiesterase class II)
MLPTVTPQELRVGMFVHLDLGWMRHPFPLSSFRIVSPDQIETIRSLGLKQLRWVPDKSELDLPPVQAPSTQAPILTSAEVLAQAQRLALADQRSATRLVERQYGEAGNALRDAWRLAQDRPVQACADAQALTRALLDKLLVDGEMCIRLVNTSVGDRASAHGLNVGVVALLMGRAFGLGEDEMLDLGLGAMLHDVGKQSLPDRVRHPDDNFSSAETAAYRDHVPHGVALGRRMEMPEGALAVLAQHHEHADGSGFPLRLNADRMTTAARIVAIVNRYDNLCNPAQVARAMTPHEALSMMFAQNRSRYDATLLNSFIRMMGVYPAGSLVQLTDDRFALVISVNSSRPLKPRVLVHDPRLPRDEALFVDLEKVANLGIRRSLPPARLPPPALAFLAPRPRVAYFFEALPARPREADE